MYIQCNIVKIKKSKIHFPFYARYKYINNLKPLKLIMP
jgi:hypothetical protein